MKDRNQPIGLDSETGENKDPDTFLLRWARRKARAERESTTDETGAELVDEPGEESNDGRVRQQSSESEHAAPDATSRAQAGEVEAEAEKGDEDMPPLDTIDQGGSVADFFSSRVSPALRQAALRRLFGQSSLPVGDDLDDYAEDYTKFTKLGDIVTNEMRHRMEVVRQRLLERSPEVEHAEVGAAEDRDLASATDPETQATDEAQASPDDGDEIVKGDADHCSDDKRVT